MPQTKRSLRGFTLLEMSIVLAIIAIVVAGGAVMFSSYLATTEWKDTTARLEAIKKALYDYRVAYNRLPCPSNITESYEDGINGTSTYFGIESATPGRCTGSSPAVNYASIGTTIVSGTTTAGSKVIVLTSNAGISVGAILTGTVITALTYFPHGTYVTAVGPGGTNVTVSNSAYAAGSGISLTFSNSIVAGGVPTRTLGLPDEYAFDAWGSRILYSVFDGFTDMEVISNIPMTDPYIRIQVFFDPSQVNYVNGVAYTLKSFGPNKHGGFARSNGARILTYSENSDEVINCGCDFDGNFASFNGNAVMSEPYTANNNLVDSFDDIVRYATRSDLRVFGE